MSPLAILVIILLILVIGFVAVSSIRRQDYHRRDPESRPPVTGDAVSEEEVIRLARSGKKIKAIKVYRELHGVGLAEAREAVEDLARGTRSRQDASGRTNPEVDDEVSRLALAGQKIEAIKRYREIHGVGLAEAKTAVEDLMARGDR